MSGIESNRSRAGSKRRPAVARKAGVATESGETSTLVTSGADTAQADGSRLRQAAGDACTEEESRSDSVSKCSRQDSNLQPSRSERDASTGVGLRKPVGLADL